MRDWKSVRRLTILMGWLALIPASAVAQITGIAGVVKDTSGAVLPGVTVEASSPALIEKVRTVVSDAQGLYQIVDLRPGRYEVTFTLPGFQTLKREGIDLIADFTATVNAELRVGAVSETITVSAQASTVDTHNVVQQQVLGDELRQDLPTARNMHNFAQLIPGTAMASGTVRPSSQDVGGTSGDRGQVILHGGRIQDYDVQIDRSGLTYIQGVSQGMAFNPAEGQEYVYEMGGLSAEHMTGGFVANAIPKQGGNRFTVFGLATYTNWQANNLDSTLINAGLKSVANLQHIYDYNAAVGGPIKSDTLWFFASFRRWGQKEFVAGGFRPIDPLSFVYNPRLGAAGNVTTTPDPYQNWNTGGSGRLTWQASPRNKFSLYYSTQPREQLGMGESGTRNFEASIDQTLPLAGNHMVQASWKAPVTSRLLLEVVYGDLRSPIVFTGTVPGVENLIGASDIGTGYTFRATPGASGTGYASCYCYKQPTLKGSVSYVTGAHVAKFGVQYEWGGESVQNLHTGQSLGYTLLNTVPVSLSMYATPRTQNENYRDLGLYAQDQWTVRRLTVNAGVRFDYHNESVPAETSGPGPFIPAINWPTVDNIPNWKDISPRLGLGYDLFGNGKTALKVTLSRYVIADGIRTAASNNPETFNTQSNRAWTNASGTYVPACDLNNPNANGECGRASNINFGTAVVTSNLDPGVRAGWGLRPYNWETSAGIQHELLPQVSTSLTYIHRWYGNFLALPPGTALPGGATTALPVADNLLLTPNDYSPYCVAVPADPRLPNAGGSLCGLYDLNPSKLGQVNNLVTDASKYGKATETYDGIDLTMSARLPRGVHVTGGLSSGTSNNIDSINSRSACFVIDNPQQLLNCNIKLPWRTAVKFLGTIPLPGGVDLGLTFQEVPGPQITAYYTITSAAAQGLGRALSGGSATVPLIAPGTMFGDRMQQTDLRIGKSFKHGGTRIRALVDVANLFNSNAVLILNTTYGANWLAPTYVLPGRVIKPNITIDF